MLNGTTRGRLEGLLEEARAKGALGPGPVGPHVDHALAMTELAGVVPARFVDLGSGAGLPGLVAALVWPDAEALFLEAHGRRAAGLANAAQELGLHHCTVRQARAEDVAREPAHRERYDLVLARSFGPPATTAECATGFLRPGGCMVVAEPPEEDVHRWPADGLADLGLGPPQRRRTQEVTVAVIPKVAPTDDRWPRRTGVPAKRPWWEAPSE